MTHGTGTASIEDAIIGLHSILKFESAQLLRFEETGTAREVFRFGYDQGCAWALANVFPARYRPGFTRWASPDALLPPTISTSAEDFRADFTNCSIYRDHLSREGYVEGMTVELMLGREPVGLAHFSSRTPDAFAEVPRYAAHSMAGLLAHLVVNYDAFEQPDPAADQSRAIRVLQPTRGYGYFATESQDWNADGSKLMQHLAGEPAFNEHLLSFAGLGAGAATHLWDSPQGLLSIELARNAGKGLIEVSAHCVGARTASGLSSQELRVLSCLSCGLSDASIAARLNLSVRTVQAHMSALRQKTGAENRVELVLMALGSGEYVPHPSLAPITEILGRRLSTAA